MTKQKAIPRLNQLLALLVKSKQSQTLVARALDISSQSLGYYMRGRKIPTSVIEKWEQVYGQDLMKMSRLDFDTDLETIIATQVSGEHATRKGQGKDAEQVVSVELWKQLQKDHAMFEKELDKAWDLIDRLLPKSAPQSVKRVDANKG